jgi:hypothetical protein
MPNWNQPFDPYNNTKCDNYNAVNVVKITDKHIEIYFPYEACWTCALQHEVPRKICYETEVCQLRIKDKYMSDVVVTKSLHGDLRQYSIHMRTALMGWLYFHDTPLIFRAGNETGTVLHHKDSNPYNNHYTNIIITDMHEKHHGYLRSFRSAIDIITEESKLVKDNRVILKQLDSLNRVYDYIQLEITDSPRVFMIIEVWDQFIKGHVSREEAETLLERLEASLPTEIIREYDMRTIKYRIEQILQFERSKEGVDAIQDVQQLVI